MENTVTFQAPAVTRGYTPEQRMTGAPLQGATQASPGIQVEASNLLLTSATPVMTLITQIKHTADQQHVARFRSQVIEEVKNFTQKLVQAEYSQTTIMAARYCICTAIDEVVLARPWGTKSVWIEEPLLSYFHKESWGGENFYVIIQNMSQDVRRNIDFLEFTYVLLSLGFEGKFFDKYIATREDIRNRLFYQIRNARNKPDRQLSGHWKDTSPLAAGISKAKVVKRLSLFTIAVLFVVSVVFNVMTHQHAAGIFQKLDQVADISPVTEFTNIVERPIVERGQTS
jgi:type VI secretion system protein ImpK